MNTHVDQFKHAKKQAFIISLVRQLASKPIVDAVCTCMHALVMVTGNSQRPSWRSQPPAMESPEEELYDLLTCHRSATYLDFKLLSMIDVKNYKNTG